MATLELYLIRHGIAAERGEHYPDDTKRPLTSDGVTRLRKEARALDALGVAFDRILTSPLVRARQTAEVFAESMRSEPPVVTVDALSPGIARGDVVDALVRHARKGRVAVVGHEPGMGVLAAYLIGARSAIPFKKGTVCCIEFSAVPARGTGTLRWFVPPRMLRGLA